MPRKLPNLLVGALTALGFGWLVVWITDSIADTLQRNLTRALDAGNYATQATVESLIHLLIPDPVLPQVPQQTDAEWGMGNLIPGADPDDGNDDPEDWTDIAEAELDPRLEPEQILLPPEARHTLTGISVPDLSAELY